MHNLIPAIITFIFHVICYGLGRIVIAGFTFGRVRCETFVDTQGFGWSGVRKTSDGAYVLSAAITTMVGLVFLALAIVLGMIAYESGG